MQGRDFRLAEDSQVLLEERNKHMPYIVQEIIEENPDLVMARADEPLLDALSRMIEHDFSQLPIVDDAGKPDGMITSDSNSASR